MAFKRCTRIVYNTLAEDFDDLEEFLDGVSVDLFVVWRRFTKTSRLFQSTYGDYSSARVFPGVPFDSESSKENQSEGFGPPIMQDADKNYCKTREFPDVPLDSESSMESLTKELCPAKTIVKETNKSDIKEKGIQTIRVNPDVVFDSESKKDEGEIDRLQDTSLSKTLLFSVNVGISCFK